MVRKLALAALLVTGGDFEVIGKEHQNGQDALDLVVATPPDVLLTDIGDAATHRTRARCRGSGNAAGCPVKVVILTTVPLAPDICARALDAGVSGAISSRTRPLPPWPTPSAKSAGGARVVDPELAAEAWTSETDPLTDRERQVLRYAGEGAASADIAALAPSIFPRSPSFGRELLLSEAISKLGAANRTRSGAHRSSKRLAVSGPHRGVCDFRYRVACSHVANHTPGFDFIYATNSSRCFMGARWLLR